MRPVPARARRQRQGFGGSPPASLTNSVKQLEKLTNEVSQIRDSLSQIERPAVEAETLCPARWQAVPRPSSQSVAA